MSSERDHIRLTCMRSSSGFADYVDRGRFLCCSRRRHPLDQVLPHVGAGRAVHVETSPDVSVCTPKVHICAHSPPLAPSQHSHWRPASATPSIRSYVPRVVGKRRKSTSGGPTDGKTSRLGAQRLGHNVSGVYRPIQRVGRAWIGSEQDFDFSRTNWCGLGPKGLKLT